MQQLDTSLLLAINGFHNTWLDQSFWYVTSGYFALFSFALVSIVFLWIYGLRKYLWFFLILLIAIIISDGIITYGFKPGVERFRPSHNEDINHLLHFVNDYHGGLHGFYSSHASNSAVLAVLAGLALSITWLRIYLFFYVFLFGFSRIYLGVHYPSDVVVGWVMGTIIGYIGYRFLYKKLHQRFGSGSYPYTNN